MENINSLIESPLAEKYLGENLFIYGNDNSVYVYEKNSETIVSDEIYSDLEKAYLFVKLGSFFGERIPQNYFKDLSEPKDYQTLIEKIVTNGQGFLPLPHGSFERETNYHSLEGKLPYNISNLDFQLFCMELRQASEHLDNPYLANFRNC